MFIFNVKYKKPLAEVDRCLPEHRRYLDALLDAGKLIASGSQEPRVGGIIICHARSEEEAREIVENDPFFIHGIADYGITRFHATKHSVDNFLSACE
ncbi:MAG: YciI family protein [Bacteroides sp.]|nr:YciI family protein [Bacteroides sp.]MCM1086348.1 YciI family protein [Bacteroides sp.]MCM1168961.1 YciI family protein [Bacteroides sp.]